IGETRLLQAYRAINSPRLAKLRSNRRDIGTAEGSASLVDGPLVAEAGDGGAEVGLGGVPEFDDERMLFEGRLDAAALDALSAAVNQADLTQAGGVGGVHVLLDDRHDVSWRERVQVYRRFDREVYRLFAVAVALVVSSVRHVRN